MLLAYKLHVLCVEVLDVWEFMHLHVFGYARRKQCVVVRLYVFQLNSFGLLYTMTCDHKWHADVSS